MCDRTIFHTAPLFFDITKHKKITFFPGGTTHSFYLTQSDSSVDTTLRESLNIPVLLYTL